MNADVIVVGAGPVGLTAALVLTQRGHRVVIVDGQAEGANTSRAAVVHSRTLELLEPYGVSGDLVTRGVPTRRFTVRDRDRMLVPVPFDGLPTRYPYTLMVSQADTEAYLLARFEELGGRVLRPARVAARPLRNAVLALAGHLPAVRRRLAWQLSGLDRR
ncbi:FAD-dependent oxidoreductase [Nonomuraea sp. NPDC004580]|uniref:FAD-dependent oxidoreductase n=1 Tax=Nonomuraea sp. NPDC004580 TaxID=3154552 RepID=UPI0033ADBE39